MAVNLNPFLQAFWADPWSGLTGPSRLYDQIFGNVLTANDFLPARSYRGMLVSPRVQRTSRESGMSEVVNNAEEFHVILDMQPFKPEQITIKTKDNRLIIHAKHPENADEHGFMTRELTRQYVLPKDVDPATLTSSMSKDRVLTIKAPKMALLESTERQIPITSEKKKVDCSSLPKMST